MPLQRVPHPREQTATDARHHGPNQPKVAYDACESKKRTMSVTEPNGKKNLSRATGVGVYNTYNNELWITVDSRRAKTLNDLFQLWLEAVRSDILAVRSLLCTALVVHHYVCAWTITTNLGPIMLQ